MSTDRNIVRDRTLVLRVLVPGLHTRLKDNIISLQDGEDDDGGPTSSGDRGGGGSGKDRLLNLDGVTCVPSAVASTLWHFRCDGTTYPARLVNLPCPVEVHKTFDHATYHKAADLGQMLIVYEDQYAMEEAENERGYRVEGFPSYVHSGLTPPMKRVVRRRFLSRFEERDTKPVPPPKHEVTELEREIQALIVKLSGEKGKGKGKGKKGAAGQASMSAAAKDKIIEEIEEELVDYEPWMGQGGVFTLEEAKMHPEWWLNKSEIRELEDAQRRAKAEEQEKRRERLQREEAEKKENEKKEAEEQEKKEADDAKAAAALAASGGDLLEQKEQQAKKKKKKDKKKKKKAAAAAAAELEAVATATATATAPDEEMDEVTQAAMTISQGGTEMEDLLFGGDDDFLNLDIEENMDLFM